MLYTKTDSNKYIAEFKERFSNFAQKAPILISFIVSDDKVTVIHENSGQQYHFEWDFTIPVKSFIHLIKQVLSDNHYPRIERKIVQQIPLTADEKAALLASGTAVEELPLCRTEVQSTIYRIDKVITMKDIFIIQDEVTNKAYRYKLNYSSIFFLKNYRAGRYKTIEEAGDFFFSKAELLNEMT